MRHALLVIFAAGFLVAAQDAQSVKKDDEMTIEKAPVTWHEKEYNPIWDTNLWFQVNWPNSPNEENKEWNVYVHPDNLKIEIDRGLDKSSLSAIGKAKKNPFWRKLQADSATLYVPNAAKKEEWEKLLRHLREGLRRGFNGMVYEKIEAWPSGKAYVTVRDIFWNAGDPMMILVSRDKISVVVGEKIGQGHRYISASGAKVFYKGNSRDPTARLEAESIVISVWSEEEAQKLRDQISKLPDE